MIIEQFYDKGLAHGSYVIINDGKAVIIDPARNPQPYYQFAEKHHAKISAVIETHPHADFVSGHLQISKEKGADVYVSKLLGADYPHKSFDEGDEIALGNVRLVAMNTPGHSPDSICILALDSNGKQHALFSGDTLFVGDVGRPDLREAAGNIMAKREELARNMYASIHSKLKQLDESVLVYPAHGAGSLCGKNLSSDLYSTIGRELRTNHAFRDISENEFVSELIRDQPFIPKYFGYNVSLNKAGATSYSESIAAVPRISSNSTLDASALVIDTRPNSQFKNGHLKGSINLQDGGKFETWLGSVVGPEEKFYLIAETPEALEVVIAKTAKIGYEKLIKGALTTPSNATEKTIQDEANMFKTNPSKFTILDTRNPGEVEGNRIFDGAIEIPLPELRERLHEIPTDKPIMVHCAAGYRSAAGASIVKSALDADVYDLGEAIVEYKSVAQ